MGFSASELRAVRFEASELVVLEPRVHPNVMSLGARVGTRSAEGDPLREGLQLYLYIIISLLNIIKNKLNLL